MVFDPYLAAALVIFWSVVAILEVVGPRWRVVPGAGEPVAVEPQLLLHGHRVP